MTPAGSLTASGARSSQAGRSSDANRVCVVTPFFNTAPYLAQCIRSVLAQTYTDFTYLLCDNNSDDGSSEIAAAYAARDDRILYRRFQEHLGQVDNYNRALRLLPSHAKYCKVVQGDDWLMPHCVAAMVEVADANPRVGLVGSYFFRGNRISGAGPDPETPVYDGRTVIREKLLRGTFGLGSPTSVMYRADLVRARQPFFPTGRYHEDTDVIYEILASSDLGFVPQLLAYQRVGNPSIRSRTADFDDDALDRLIQVESYAKRFLDPDEASELLRATRRAYFRRLGDRILEFAPPPFWKYQFDGLATLGWHPPIGSIAIGSVMAAVSRLLNPLDTLRQWLRHRQPR